MSTEQEKTEQSVPPTPTESTPAAELSPAEQQKKLGNDAFIAKNYKQAIEHYTAALQLDPNNAVYFANRSACHASLKDWQKAYEDALQSVAKDPKYIKGYYRLSSAQAELQMFDDAETTLRTALTMEPESEVILRQIKALKTKKTAAANAAAAAKRSEFRKLDEAQMKEFMELQEQINTYNRDLRTVKMKLASLQRESRVNSMTANHIETLDRSTPLYRSVGKTFLFCERSEIEKRLEDEIAELTKSQRDLTDRQEYLERRIASNTANLQDLVKA